MYFLRNKILNKKNRGKNIDFVTIVSFIVVGMVVITLIGQAMGSSIE